MPTHLHRRHCLQLLGGAAVWTLGVPSQASSKNTPPALQTAGQLLAWPATQPTPSLKALALNGQTRSLSDFTGAPMILNFWASYCAPCLLEIPQFNQLLQLHRAAGLRIAAVNHGEMPARVLQFLQTTPFQGDVLLDRSQTQLSAWGGIALPTSIVIDAQSRAHWWHMGEIDWLSADTQAKLATVLRL